MSEVDELAGHTPREPVDPRDPVAHLDDRTDVDRLGLALEAPDLGSDDVGDFGRSACHGFGPPLRSELLPERVQFGVKRRVDETVADLHFRPADECRVDREGRAQLSAARAFEEADEAVAFRIVQRDGGRYPRLGNALPPIDDVAEGARDIRHERDAVTLEEEQEQRTDRLGLALRRRGDGSLPLLERYGRVTPRGDRDAVEGG